MPPKNRSSAKQSDRPSKESPTVPPTNLITDRELRLLNRKKPKVDSTVDTDFTSDLKLNPGFKFKNNFAPLPIITTDTVVMVPAKKLDKGKAKETLPPTPTAPPPPKKIPKTPTAPPAPQPPVPIPEDTKMPDANPTEPEISNQHKVKTSTK